MNFAVGIGEYRVASKGDKDAFMAKYDHNANFIWAHSFGEVAEDKALNLDLDDDEIYLTGSFQNTVDFDPDTTLNSSNTASANGSVFFSKFSICQNNHSFDSLKVCPGSASNYGSYYSFSEAGDHHLRLVDPAGCDTLITLHVEMNDTVDVTVYHGSATLIANNSSASVQWIDCVADTLIPGADSVAFTPLANGNYAAIITDSATSCVDTSNCIAYFPIGIKESSKNHFRMYPNPVKDQLIIESSDNSRIKLFDQIGKLVLTDQVLKGKNQLNLSHLNSGVYFIRFENSNNYKKIILQ
jgi:hypothetical protein